MPLPPIDVALLDAIAHPVFIVDGEWRYVGHNRHAAAHCPVPISEVGGRTVWELFPDIVGTRYESAYRRAMAERRPVELLEPSPRSSSWFQTMATPFHDGLCIHYHDVTEQFRAIEELSESRTLLEAAEELAHIGSWALDVDTDELTWSRELYQIFELDPIGGMTRDRFLDHVRPGQRDVVNRALRTVMDTAEPVMFECPIVRSDGAVRTLSLRARAQHDPSGRVVRVVGSAQDISERVEAEAARRALRDQEEQHRLVTDGLPVLISYVDRDQRYRFVNRAYETTLGFTREHVLGRHLREVLGDEVYGRIREHMRAALAGQSVSFESDLEANGMLRHLAVTYLPHRDHDGKVLGVYSVLADETERRHLEEQLRQSQKMEAVGRLAGGVAHDFNNLLTVVTVHCEMLLASLPDASPLRPDIEEIQTAGRRAAALTRQLLAFSRRQVLTLETFNLNDVVSEAGRMFRRIIGEDVRVQSTLAAELAPVRADRGQMTQVLMNLVVNARDAMPGGGTLEITTRNAVVDAALALRRRGLVPGEYVELCVADTGSGMSEATLARIFEPFYTTKEAGKGTGLGLSTVYGIVKQLEGFIFVDSTVGRGTTFTIYLPRGRPGAEPVAASTTLRTAPPRGSEVVLLVEDDPSVRQIARRALERQGYIVLEAGDGDAALRLSEQHAGTIDLLLTDVIMPGMGGLALAARLRDQRPRMKVIFMSGYNEAAIANQGVLAPGATLIEKPFTADALAHLVRDVLGAPPSRALRHPAS